MSGSIFIAYAVCDKCGWRSEKKEVQGDDEKAKQARKKAKTDVLAEAEEHERGKGHYVRYVEKLTFFSSQD